MDHDRSIVCSEEHVCDETWSNMVHTHLIQSLQKSVLESWQEYVEFSKSLIKHVTFSASYV